MEYMRMAGKKRRKKKQAWGARDLQDININRWRLLEVGQSVDSEGCWLVVMMMMMMMVRITCQPLEIEPLKKSQFQLCADRIFIGKNF